MFLQWWDYFRHMVKYLHQTSRTLRQTLPKSSYFDKKIAGDELTDFVFFIVECLARRFPGSFMSWAWIYNHRTNKETSLHRNKKNKLDNKQNELRMKRPTIKRLCSIVILWVALLENTWLVECWYSYVALILAWNTNKIWCQYLKPTWLSECW